MPSFLFPRPLPHSIVLLWRVPLHFSPHSPPFDPRLSRLGLEPRFKPSHLSLTCPFLLRLAVSHLKAPGFLLKSSYSFNPVIVSPTNSFLPKHRPAPPPDCPPPGFTLFCLSSFIRGGDFFGNWTRSAARSGLQPFSVPISGRTRTFSRGSISRRPPRGRSRLKGEREIQGKETSRQSGRDRTWRTSSDIRAPFRLPASGMVLAKHPKLWVSSYGLTGPPIHLEMQD